MERTEMSGAGTVVVDSSDATVKKSRPFRGLFWGLLIGVGLAGVLVFSATITLSILAVAVCIVVGVLVGVVWGVVGPAKAPEGPPPSTRVIVQQVPASRFDDFGPPTSEKPPVAATPATAASTAPTSEPPATNEATDEDGTGETSSSEERRPE